MKVNELMIGDWVKCEEYPFRISDISFNRIYAGEGYFDVDSIEPIPLTTEILENNGYYGLGTARGINGFMGDDSDITIDNVGNGDFTLDISLNTWTNDSCVSITIKYVHELQRALRLCRLNELADNFKI